MRPQDMPTKNHQSKPDFTNKKLVDFSSKENSLHYEEIFDIEPQELAKKIDDVIVIDVRQPDEFNGELGHIPNSQLFVLDELEETLALLPKDKTIVFVCHSGGRSTKAAYLAIQNGYNSVFNLKGGLVLWTELHLPTEA